MTNLAVNSEPPLRQGYEGQAETVNGSMGVIASIAKQSSSGDLHERLPRPADGPRNDIQPVTNADRAILEGLVKTTTAVTKEINDFQFQLAAEAIYDFIWNQFASTYLEAAKLQLRSEDPEQRAERVVERVTSEVTGPADPELTANTRAILLYVLKQSLALLHPFMPFVTEAIWQHLPKASGDSDLLITQAWPTNNS